VFGDIVDFRENLSLVLYDEIAEFKAGARKALDVAVVAG
jgi:hypothetical protein